MNYKLKTRSEWLDEYHQGVRYGLQGKLILEESWEKIKNNEKPLNNSKTPISDRLKLKIRPQPSTKAALIISKKAAKNGFEWEKSDQIWDKLYEELEELKDALKRKYFRG